ncbi:MAG TPA: class I SAM-dependent rRNA methyltransferase [Candidatus Borkfalkia stercoripullorum]|nr:class I SAM-dependent rRNA methyltransferase [Candidatus Borkfalkia stercoripullorum]
MPYTVYLKKGEEKRILGGHSWVYANEVQKIEGKDKNGSLAEVRAFDGRFVGKGYVNHLSKILVRIFIRTSEEDGKELYLKRIAAADLARKKLISDSCYRMVFAEADDLPALVVDRYGDYLVLECLSLGVDMRKNMIAECLNELFSPKGIYMRGDAAVRQKEGLPLKNETLSGEVPDKIYIEENGIKMAVDVKRGQKTGYFLDQKENRFACRRYAKGGEVLDCFCNSGGFSLNAAASAARVTAVDISPFALENVRENAALNGFENIDTLCADAFEALRDFKKQGRSFDFVILDPPAFCKSAAEVKDAARGYRDVNLNAMKLVKPGGYLLTCSCSHYMTLPLFERAVAEAARASGRRVKCLEVKVQAPDHPALLTAEETSYLKALYLQID